mmetsp:Transcript_89158/g.251024  ORF Transcript_89158/g.251024 Transcript_89158/m.251024 type:complete len:657 (-) Transcript_89158:3-1973(-)
MNKAALDAARSAAGIGPNGVLRPADENGKPLPDFRTKQDEVNAINAAARLASSVVSEAVSSVELVKLISPKGLLEVITPLKSATKPDETEVEQMFRLLLAGPDENGQYGVSERPERGGAAPKSPPYIPVFQMDKALQKGREVLDKARRWSCLLTKTESERTAAEKVCFSFFEEIRAKLLERSQWLQGQVEDIFADCNELTPDLLLRKAAELGVAEHHRPRPEELTALLIEVVGRREAPMGKNLAYRAIALMQEGRMRQKQKALAARLQCLTHAPVDTLRQVEGPKDVVFGLPAFVECLLKLALHRLGYKGGSDIQRNAPAWWKCTWLLTFIGGQFAETINTLNFERRIFELAVEGEGSWDEAFSDTIGVGPPCATTGTYGIDSWLASERGVQRAPSIGASSTGSSGEFGAKTGTGSGTGTGSNRNGVSPPRRNVLLGTPRKSITPQPGGTPRARSGLSDDGTSSVGGQSSKTPTGKARRGESKRMKREPIATGKAIDKGPNQDAEVWWRKMQVGRLQGLLPRNMPTVEWLATEQPDMFEPVNAEVPLSEHVTSSPAGTLRNSRRIATEGGGGSSMLPCGQCGEKTSTNGWGNPNCTRCGSVEELCLPIETHIFGALLRTCLPQKDGDAVDDEVREFDTEDYAEPDSEAGLSDCDFS